MTLAARLYGLWIQGTTIDQIVELNPGLTRGAILKARVDGLWDARKEAYQAELMVQAQDRVKLIALESVNFIGLLLAVSNKKHGEALKKYMLSGDENDLNGFDIKNIRDYKAVLETLVKITGQDKPSTPSVNVTAAPGSSVEVGGVSVQAGWSPEEADRIREILEKKGNG